MRKSLVLAAVLLLSGCKTLLEAPDEQDTSNKPFTPTGGVVFKGGSASFDDAHVRGPLINASRRSDGDWAGTLNGQPLDVTVKPDRLVGSYLNMKIEQNLTGLVMTGQWMNRIHRFEVNTDQVMIRLPSASFTLHRSGEGQYGPAGALKLTGDAAKQSPPMPQFAFALLATFIASEVGSGVQGPQQDAVPGQ